MDLTEHFQADYGRRGVNLYYKTNTHWGKEGNRLAAAAGLLAAVAAFVLARRRRAAPPGCPT